MLDGANRAPLCDAGDEGGLAMVPATIRTTLSANESGSAISLTFFT